MWLDHEQNNSCRKWSARNNERSAQNNERSPQNNERSPQNSELSAQNSEQLARNGGVVACFRICMSKYTVMPPDISWGITSPGMIKDLDLQMYQHSKLKMGAATSD